MNLPKNSTLSPRLTPFTGGMKFATQILSQLNFEIEEMLKTIAN
jgi:hypothetical protein